MVTLAGSVKFFTEHCKLNYIFGLCAFDKHTPSVFSFMYKLKGTDTALCKNLPNFGSMPLHQPGLQKQQDNDICWI